MRKSPRKALNHLWKTETFLDMGCQMLSTLLDQTFPRLTSPQELACGGTIAKTIAFHNTSIILFTSSTRNTPIWGICWRASVVNCNCKQMAKSLAFKLQNKTDKLVHSDEVIIVKRHLLEDSEPNPKVLAWCV